MKICITVICIIVMVIIVTMHKNLDSLKTFFHFFKTYIRSLDFFGVECFCETDSYWFQKLWKRISFVICWYFHACSNASARFSVCSSRETRILRHIHSQNCSTASFLLLQVSKKQQTFEATNFISNVSLVQKWSGRTCYSLHMPFPAKISGFPSI